MDPVLPADPNVVNTQAQPPAAPVSTVPVAAVASSPAPATPTAAPLPTGFLSSVVNGVKKFFQKVGDELKEVGEDVVKEAAKVGHAIKADFFKTVDDLEMPAVTERNARADAIMKKLATAGLTLSVSFDAGDHNATLTGVNADQSLTFTATGVDRCEAAENLVAIIKKSKPTA